MEEQATNPVHTLYRAAIAADQAWHDELVKVFGKRAGDARYTAQGSSTPTLAALRQTKIAADTALHLAQRPE